MNKAKLKTYAPQARKDFIAAVTQRANLLGLSESAGKFEALPAERRGDVVLIAGREWPARVAQQRERLVRRIQRDGFVYTMEAVAYTWFNRFAALRYMELHDYLGHGHRVLSSATAGGLPDILAHAADLATSRELPGLDAAHIAELKLAGNKDGELYRLLLVAQCNALSAAMPFLFERIDDETELLLPDNLLRTDSVIAKLVAEVPEEDWAQVEIIGWLYQFYISEKKDQVIGKVVKSEDIPAATQLFTPNWIVQYLVQNSVGRLWLMANPTSTLKAEWPYYIEPAEQTADVGAALAAITQARIDEDGGSLNPESITVLDPACGSGHILVEAYALLKGIYLERGYRLRDIPRLILEKNLYGLDIDDRAAQLAGFALLMKARADDRRLFNDPPRLNVLSLQESKGLDLDELATYLAPFGVLRGTVKALLDTFEHAKTFGSLIQIPDALNGQLPTLAEALAKANETGDLYAQAAAQDLMPLVEQARVLGRKFDAVVANPPYMGSSYINQLLKTHLKSFFAGCEKDLFSSSVARYILFLRRSGALGCVTPFTWLFTSSYAALRERLMEAGAVTSLVKPSFTAFFESAIVSLCAFVFQRTLPDFRGEYFDLGHLGSGDSQAGKLKLLIEDEDSGGRHRQQWRRFELLPGKPISYGMSDKLFDAFLQNERLDKYYRPCEGLKTGDNNLFLRYWYEVDHNKIATNATSFEALTGTKFKWLWHHKGGEYRRWYGNHEYVINWSNNGQEIKSHPKSTVSNLGYQLKEGVTWSYISASYFGVRYSPQGFTFNNKGPMLFGSDAIFAAAYLCSSIGSLIMKNINPTMNFSVGNIASLPFPSSIFSGRGEELMAIAQACVSHAKSDWDANEVSADFAVSPLLSSSPRTAELESSWLKHAAVTAASFSDMKILEERNNTVFINAFSLQNEVDPRFPEDQITLARADREKDSQRLISYTIGCMMGRYSLDEPGLIYAHAGNVGFDPTRYKTFPADADGIVPITDEFWFEDDAANRVREFLRAVWGADTLDENMAWLAESLGTKAGETPDETIRRYLADKFFRDHLQTYKKRPIYWLLSSGKQGAFQALVYLHRYHEGTLARLRAEYVVPLTGKMQARIEMLEKDATAASSTAARNKLNKQIEKLRKKHVELLAYDEKLRHYADMRINLDLDDGVKVNYGKFGDLLAEVKAVTGGVED